MAGDVLSTLSCSRGEVMHTLCNQNLVMANRAGGTIEQEEKGMDWDFEIVENF